MGENLGGVVMWTIQGRFTIFGYQTPEVDLTAVLAVGVIALIVLCLAQYTPTGG